MSKLDHWDKRFLHLAEMIATWSKDVRTKVGAVIVDEKHRIISTGFNGFPHGISDKIESIENRKLKLEMTIHAEENALLFSQQTVVGMTLYVTPYMPCSRCAAKIIQSGIKRVVAPVPEDGCDWMKSFNLSKRMFEEAGVALILEEN